MKQFFCGDVIPGCTAVFRSETDQTILKEVTAHAVRDHGISQPPPGLVEQVRAHIHEVPA